MLELIRRAHPSTQCELDYQGYTAHQSARTGRASFFLLKEIMIHASYSALHQWDIPYKIICESFTALGPWGNTDFTDFTDFTDSTPSAADLNIVSAPPAFCTWDLADGDSWELPARLTLEPDQKLDDEARALYERLIKNRGCKALALPPLLLLSLIWIRTRIRRLLLN